MLDRRPKRPFLSDVCGCPLSALSTAKTRQDRLTLDACRYVEMGGTVENRYFRGTAMSLVLWRRMTSASDRFKAILAEDFAPWLTQRGFRRRDAVFRRRREDAWQIIDFQRDKYSDAKHLRFTINLGISLDVVQDEPSWLSRGWPLTAQCDLRERAGQLHKGDDYWWSVKPLWPVRGVVQDALAALETSLRWADTHVAPQAFLRYALSGDVPTNPVTVLALAKLVGTSADVKAAEAKVRPRS